MTINSKKCVIEMSKKEAAAAMKFGTQEYMDLQEVRRDYPNFKIVVIKKSGTKKIETYKGLTYAYMEMYIQKNDDEKKTIMTEYEMLRGISEEAKEALAEPCSYQEMRDWFLKKFPAIAKFHEDRAKLLAAG